MPRAAQLLGGRSDTRTSLPTLSPGPSLWQEDAISASVISTFPGGRGALDVKTDAGLKFPRKRKSPLEQCTVRSSGGSRNRRQALH